MQIQNINILPKTNFQARLKIEDAQTWYKKNEDYREYDKTSHVLGKSANQILDAFKKLEPDITFYLRYNPLEKNYAFFNKERNINYFSIPNANLFDALNLFIHSKEIQHNYPNEEGIEKNHEVFTKDTIERFNKVA